MTSRLVVGLCTLVLAVLALAGCGGMLRTVYNNGDWAVRLAAHEYFDLHGAQSDALRDHLDQFHGWHRRTELPLYASLAVAAGERIDRGVKREDVTWAIERVRARYRALAERAITESTPVLAMLGPANVIALEKKLAESTDKWEKEYLRGAPEKRERARLKAMQKRIEEFTGPLNKEQVAMVAAYVRDSPQYSQTRLADRRARQQALVAIIRDHRRSPDLAQRLRAHFVTYERDRGPEYAAYVAEWEDRVTRLVIDLDRTLTREQRRSAVARFDQLGNDFSVLAGLPEPQKGVPRRAQGVSMGGG